MARITVEDCIEKIPNRFDLVISAAQRSRDISRGEKALVPRERDKSTVVALREIAESLIEVDLLEELAKSYQKIKPHAEKNDEEFVELVDTHTYQAKSREEKADPFFQVAKKDEFIAAVEAQPGLSKFEDVDVDKLEDE